MILFFIIITGILALVSLKIVNEYEKGVKFTLGKYSGVMEPGLQVVIPIIQSWERIDMRTKVQEVPSQDAITKDNVTIKINAVLYFHVQDATMAVIEVQNFLYAVTQLAQTTMRNIIGEVTLDDLLSSRESIAKKIQVIVDKESDPWGIKIESVELKDIELPQDMKRVISKQAEADRERRAVIIRAQGELQAAKNIAQAAKNLTTSKGAMHLRTLQTINDLSADKSLTNIYVIPQEILHFLQRK